MRSNSVASCVVGIVVAACATPGSVDKAPASGAPPVAAAPAPDKKPWESGAPVHFRSLNDDDQKAYMKEVVVPRMTEVLQKLDPKEFEKVTCKTCHGENIKERGFEMPSPDIHVLDFVKDKVEHDKEMKFMSEQVVPEMARLLGEPQFDPATKTGFGCMGCHTAAAH